MVCLFRFIHFMVLIFLYHLIFYVDESMSYLCYDCCCDCLLFWRGKHITCSLVLAPPSRHSELSSGCAHECSDGGARRWSSKGSMKALVLFLFSLFSFLFILTAYVLHHQHYPWRVLAKGGKPFPRFQRPLRRLVV